MANEDVTWVDPGHYKQDDAWKQAEDYNVDKNAVMRNMRKSGVNVSVGVRKKGAKFYVVIIKRL